MKLKLMADRLFGRRLTETGAEIPDPTPIAPPVGFTRQPSLAEQIRAMVRSEKLAMEAEEAGYETFEEADDFDVPDDPFPEALTPYNVDVAPPDSAFGPGSALINEGRSDPAQPATPPQASPEPANPPSSEPA